MRFSSIETRGLNKVIACSSKLYAVLSFSMSAQAEQNEIVGF